MKKRMRCGKKGRSGAAGKAGLLLAAVGLALGILPLHAAEEVVLDWESVPAQAPARILVSGAIHHDALVDPRDVEKCIDCHYRKHKSKPRACASKCLDDPGAVHHPVFSKYPPDRKEAEYVPIATLEKNGIVKFQNSRMTCLTCHNVANNLPYHLIIEDRESRFCRLCHIR
jgi:hypothetical protein